MRTLTIREAQRDLLQARRINAFVAELLQRVRRRYPDPCAALGEARTIELLTACLAVCRDNGAAGREAIFRMIDSLFQRADLLSLDSAEAARAVRSELNGRHLLSMLETANGVAPA